MDGGKLVQLTTKVRNNLDFYEVQIETKGCQEGETPRRRRRKGRRKMLTKKENPRFSGKVFPGHL